MSFTVVIPARYDASRLPGKPLLDLAGQPILQRTWERARCSNAAAVYIATDDERIDQVARGFGARVLMTSPQHRSGSDRVQEAARQLELPDNAIVVNLQGDEPLIPPAVIDQVAGNLQARPATGMATLCQFISEAQQAQDPNVVKVVMDRDHHALYFSRAPIPWPLAPRPGYGHRHIGIYAWRIAILNRFVSWPAAETELCEKLEQLRALHNGVRIHVDVATEPVPPGIDTEQELTAARARLTAGAT